ncbi:MAG: deoxyribodipyrimidine photo-lyase [Trueperaceae bacterium]|nr:MAG: deoxyribodipyrimidine photo-lyase [Trueperaceae bacterium]
MHLVWHRGDLRIHDHPALTTALSRGPVLGIVVLDESILSGTSARRRAWFYANVQALRESYRQRGGTLLVRKGTPWNVLPELVASTGAEAVHALASYTPYGLLRDQKTEASLHRPLYWHPGCYLYEPGTVSKDDGTPYTVYTPFRKRAQKSPLPEPLPSPTKIESPTTAELGTIPEEASDIPLPDAGESKALELLERFLNGGLAHYHLERDGLDGSGVSRLSVYLTLGVLSPRLAASLAAKRGGPGAESWIRELLWRDFMADLLYHYPHMRTEAFDRRWNDLPWQNDPELFEAWCRAKTGIPVIDAAMRELKTTGWISNRPRMIVAQFLVKHLLLPWQWGEKIFKEWLLDGDTANNLGGWHWAGGLGVDAAPYFRVFNLVTQATKHDPEGSWLRRWHPESGGNPEPVSPLIDIAAARARYLEAAKQLSRRPSDLPAPRDPLRR